MTNKKIEQYKQKMGEILNKKAGNLALLTKMHDDLQSIAGEIGATKYLGTSALNNLEILLNKFKEPEAKCDVMQAMIAERVYNINDALRTETMINCAKAASKSLIASVIAATIALVSAAAAWFAVIKN